MGWVVNAEPHLPYSRERDLALTVQEAGWAPELVWMGAENLAPLGFNPQDIQPVANCYTN